VSPAVNQTYITISGLVSSCIDGKSLKLSDTNIDNNHAKMKFTKSKNGSDGIAQCDIYQSRIDLLSILVSDNFKDLPSIQELTKPDIVM
jgi:hypothetical protein